MTAPTITIAPEPFGCGFDVAIVPPPEGVGHDREFPAYSDARAYADRLGEAMRWLVRDLCGEGAGT